MKLWIDDIRPAPEGYIWVKSVNEAKNIISAENTLFRKLVTEARDTSKLPKELFDRWLIDLDHDAGEYTNDGGDYIKLLDWIEWLGADYIDFHIHSQNPVGIENMRRIIRRNGWTEV